jgi:hypothetical protein
LVAFGLALYAAAAWAFGAADRADLRGLLSRRT